MNQSSILGSGELGYADFTASRPYRSSILGMGEFAGESTHPIFSIKHFRSIISHAVVLGTDRLGPHDCIFLLHGMSSEYFHKSR